MTGHRGSSSTQASEYKLQGHRDEALFCQAISGHLKSDNKTGKADVIGPDNKIYSVKGASKKWQIFLYGHDRFKNDREFQDLNGVGQLLLDGLDCFPIGYEGYLRDKNVCKKILSDYFKVNPNEGALKDPRTLKSLFPAGNHYYESKIKLQAITKKISLKFSDKDCLRKFLDKAIFNMAEVDRVAIKRNKDFLIFEKNDVLDILVNNLNITISDAGNRRSDLNIGGQKIVMKYKTNIVEIEIRNDSVIHYRQVRFNMLREKALELLLSQCFLSMKLQQNAHLYKKTAHTR
jgi:hypothetical protein